MSSISLLMTVYDRDRDRYLTSSIQSVLAQTYPNFELLLWNDGSTDNSLHIAQHVTQQDPRIKVFSAPHQGRVLALQSAHAQAQGEYLGWIDSDDLLAPTALEETVAILETNPQIGLVYSDYLVIDENGIQKGLGSRCQILYSKNRLLVNFMTFHFRLFQRTAFEQAGVFMFASSYI
jgi:glycosyltransferase involved in cell wall biosynthesis